VWCAIGPNLNTDELARLRATETTVPEWRERLVCSACGTRNADMVVTGTERR
jgi:hypothetical protein